MITMEYASLLLTRVTMSDKYTAKGIKIWYKHNDPKQNIQGKIWAPGCEVSETVDITKILSTPMEKAVKGAGVKNKKSAPWGVSKVSLAALLLAEHLKEGGPE